MVVLLDDDCEEVDYFALAAVCKELKICFTVLGQFPNIANDISKVKDQSTIDSMSEDAKNLFDYGPIIKTSLGKVLSAIRTLKSQSAHLDAGFY